MNFKFRIIVYVGKSNHYLAMYDVSTYLAHDINFSNYEGLDQAAQLRRYFIRN